MEAKELRAMNLDQLGEELKSRLREQFNLRMQKGAGQLSRPDQVKKVRRDIARIRTIINEKKREAGAGR